MNPEKTIGRFTEGLEYTVHGKPLKHPIWMPNKPDPRWTIITNKDFTAATAKHPDHPSVIFGWDPRTDVLSAYIEWQGGPVYVNSVEHICAVPQLFNEFMYTMMTAAEMPIHMFPNDKIKIY